MVKKYFEFINEGKFEAPLTYSVITALAIINPTFFDFLNSAKNRYILTDNSFWQSFIIEIKNSNNIKIDKQHLVDIKGVSIENDWFKLKKCFDASIKIKERFPEAKQIEVLNSGGLIINSENTLKNKNKLSKISTEGLLDFLGITFDSIYSNPLWNTLITEWIRMVEQSLNPELVGLYKELKASMNGQDWDSYKSAKIKGLGIKIDFLPKLYYNSFYDLNKDLNESCFVNYKQFVKDWIEIKNDILNKKILYPLLNTKQSRITDVSNLLAQYHSIESSSYFKFDSKLNIVEVPDYNNFISNLNEDFIEKYLISKNEKDFIVQLQSVEHLVKITIATKHLCPSSITVKYKITESNDAEL